LTQQLRSSAVDAMVTEIRGIISAGGLGVGDSLPTERELCERFSTSRNTVREAMRILKAYGLVEVRPKVGATIIDDRMARALELFSFDFRTSAARPSPTSRASASPSRSARSTRSSPAPPPPTSTRCAPSTRTS
jgi:DNA-binding FadR family transcriptional regulator